MTLPRFLRPQAAEIALFASVFATYLIYLRAFGDPHFYFDTANYWELGGTFGPAGHFSLLDFDSTVRGYSLPLLNRALASVATSAGLGSVAIVQVFGSLEVALLSTVLVPRLVRALWPAARVTPTRILLFNGIVFLFWRDHLGFPGSDFPALTLGVAALLALSRRSPAGYALAGLAIGLAWNVRQAYLMMLLFVLVLAALRGGIRRTPVRAAGAVCLVLAGVLAASLPQMLINDRHSHTWSPTVVQSKAIVLGNLTLGMRAQRYETNVGTGYPSPGVFYLDPSTQKSLQQDGIETFASYTQYARVVERHPTEMIAGWARRVFNELDVRFPTPYIHDLGATSEWYSLIDYTLLFAAFAQLLVPAFRRQLGKLVWPEPVALCAASLTAIPLMADPRYFLPVHFVFYSLVVFASGTRRGWAELGRGGRITLAVLYPTFLVLCFTLSTSTIALIASA